MSDTHTMTTQNYGIRQTKSQCGTELRSSARAHFRSVCIVPLAVRARSGSDGGRRTAVRRTRIAGFRLASSESSRRLRRALDQGRHSSAARLSRIARFGLARNGAAADPTGHYASIVRSRSRDGGGGKSGEQESDAELHGDCVCEGE